MDDLQNNHQSQYHRYRPRIPVHTNICYRPLSLSIHTAPHPPLKQTPASNMCISDKIALDDRYVTTSYRYKASDGGDAELLGGDDYLREASTQGDPERAVRNSSLWEINQPGPTILILYHLDGRIDTNNTAWFPRGVRQTELLIDFSGTVDPLAVQRAKARVLQEAREALNRTDRRSDGQYRNVDEGLDGQFRLVDAEGVIWLIRLQDRKIEAKDVDELLPRGDDILDGAIDSLEATVSLTTLGMPRSLDDTRSLVKAIRAQADRHLSDSYFKCPSLSVINTMKLKLEAESDALGTSSLPSAQDLLPLVAAALLRVRQLMNYTIIRRCESISRAAVPIFDYTPIPTAQRCLTEFTSDLLALPPARVVIQGHQYETITEAFENVCCYVLRAER